MLLPLLLYSILLSLSIFAPMRWALISYLMLSAVDFNTGNAGIGVFNAAKGLLCPVVLLWRLREYGGHAGIIVAPIAWLLLTTYAAIGSIWSLFGLSAIKLAAEMAGSFLICMVFLRASKGGFLKPIVVLPVTVGVIAIALLRMIYIHFAGDPFATMAGDTPNRFTAFVSAQSFAALLTALYAIAVTSFSIKPLIRIALCASIFASLLLDGSRLWLIAFVVASFLALLISSTPVWLRIVGVGAAMLLVLGIVAASQSIIDLLQGLQASRVAAAITAAYAGDQNSAGLGTLEVRRELSGRALDMIEAGSVAQIFFGHGTSNGRLVQGSLSKGVGDPNRAVHNEWLRIMYEWGVVGVVLWISFLSSLMFYAYRGLQVDRLGYAKPLFIYIPALCIGVTGENILAGAGQAENMGLLLLIGLAGMAYRRLPVKAELTSLAWHGDPLAVGAYDRPA